MIPKIIHYCWFGNNEKPEKVKECIKSWNKMDGYKVIEWNEKNCDLKENQYVIDAYNSKKYAFVSDYIRLKVLYKYGGIYLDTDVQIKKKFEDKFLQNDIILSFMYNCNISTAIIGAQKNNSNIKKILEFYEKLNFIEKPNNDIFTEFLINNYKEFRLNNKEQIIDNGNIHIYPKEYFEAPKFNRKKGYSIHHFEASWQKEKSIIRKLIKLILPNYIYHFFIRKKAILNSPFKERYFKDKKQ